MKNHPVESMVVILEPCTFRYMRRIIQKPSQEYKGFIFVQNARLDRLRELNDKAHDFVSENFAAFNQPLIEDCDGVVWRQEFSEGVSWFVHELHDLLRHCFSRSPAFVAHHPKYFCAV